MPFIKRPLQLRRLFRPGPGGSHASTLLKLLGAAAIIMGIISLIILPTNRYLDDVASKTALNHVASRLTSTVNETVNKKLDDNAYNYDYFVDLQRDEGGNLIAVAANMARINKFATEVLSAVITSTESGELDLSVPLGTLLGSSLLLGRGPNIPVKPAFLTTSFATFRNQFESVGINQSRHQIILEIRMELNVVLPWEIKSTEVYCEVLVAETIVVGKVPDTYLDITS